MPGAVWAKLYLLHTQVGALAVAVRGVASPSTSIDPGGKRTQPAVNETTQHASAGHEPIVQGSPHSPSLAVNGQGERACAHARSRQTHTALAVCAHRNVRHRSYMLHTDVCGSPASHCGRYAAVVAAGAAASRCRRRGRGSHQRRQKLFLNRSML